MATKQFAAIRNALILAGTAVVLLIVLALIARDAGGLQGFFQ